ncbi:hypothetical protein J4E08_06310 [Sagittula sp. NFXS13]|uniref:sensor histidine kinase n=1 Tax=Sagittula sp. NFXS13 TaxID=2819095 RepID=UPI0032E03A6E
MMPQDARQDMQLLHEVEYGVPQELIMRLVGICIGAVMMYIYDASLLPVAWCLGYLVSHAVHYRFVTSRLDQAEPHDLVTAGVLYLVVVVSFMWLPSYYAMQHEPIHLYIGTVLIASTMVYQIRRGDRHLWLSWAQILIFAVMVTVVMASHLHDFTRPIEWIGAIFVTCAGFVYVGLAMLYARKSRLETEEAAQRLAQDQKMSAIGRLAGGVAHDFNNMLTVVKGNLELYHLLDDPQDRADAIHEAQMAAERAEEVVHHLLVYARKAPMRPRVMDANEAVVKTMTLIRTMVPEGIEKRVDRWHHRLPMEVDDGQFATALLNLVKNSVDAMSGQGTLLVKLSLENVGEERLLASGARLAPGKYVAICVRDSGSGIPPEILARVSEPFFTTKPTGKGTGLGLSMVAGFLQSAGGGLCVRSDTAGTAVTMLIPAREIQGAPLPDTKAAALPDNSGIAP